MSKTEGESKRVKKRKEKIGVKVGDSGCRKNVNDNLELMNHAWMYVS